MPVLFGLKRRKTIRITAISFVFLIIVFLVLYFYKDIIVRPLEGLNSMPLFGEWPMFRRDLEHSGSASPSSLLPQGEMKWVFETADIIRSSPALTDTAIFAGSDDGHLYARMSRQVASSGILTPGIRLPHPLPLMALRSTSAHTTVTSMPLSS